MLIVIHRLFECTFGGSYSSAVFDRILHSKENGVNATAMCSCSQTHASKGTHRALISTAPSNEYLLPFATDCERQSYVLRCILDGARKLSLLSDPMRGVLRAILRHCGSDEYSFMIVVIRCFILELIRDAVTIMPVTSLMIWNSNLGRIPAGINLRAP